ncbi:MAG: AmmeMemoRadiSam system radical SAM enzyme [Deltaproteobacteria bacterium]|nr:AmmeMemoRadiSam system radical SAM enzyme [Deltaproteobacteria bacterium]
MKEGMFYRKKEDRTVECGLCNHRCIIKDGARGVCGVRENRDGALLSLVYGKCVSQGVDPIEKKPLYHFYPGSESFSIAAVGCNFRCRHCQNYGISQMPRDRGAIVGDDVTPEKIVAAAQYHECASISYTYTEPTIYYEYAYDIAALAHERNIRNVFVTNGYITSEALRHIRPFLDAANVDLKSFSEGFYREVCGARLQPVLDSLKLYKELGIWVEVTTLIIPTYNDSESELKEIAGFIASLGAETPWHISAYYPTYKLTDQSRTPVETLRRAREIGLAAGLRYVYVGNVWGEKGENTYCYSCGSLLIERRGFIISCYRITNNACPECGSAIDGVGLS